MRDARTSIVILDANETARRGLRALLHAEPDLHVIAECATARDGVGHVARFVPQVVVMDPALPDAAGLETCRVVRQQAPDVRVVMLLARVDGRAVLRGVRAGAIGLLSKRAPLPEICAAIRAAAAGIARLDAPATAALFAQLQHADTDAGDEPLTEAERRVLARVVAGCTNRQIAHELGLSEKRVKTQLSRAFAKLHVTRRARAAVVFVADGGVSGGIHQPHQAA